MEDENVVTINVSEVIKILKPMVKSLALKTETQGMKLNAVTLVFDGFSLTCEVDSVSDAEQVNG